MRSRSSILEPSSSSAILLTGKVLVLDNHSLFSLLFAAIEWINLPPFSWVRSNLAFGRSSLYLVLAVGVVIVGLIWKLAQGTSNG